MAEKVWSRDKNASVEGWPDRDPTALNLLFRPAIQSSESDSLNG
jgi:hypothetical protein